MLRQRIVTAFVLLAVLLPALIVHAVWPFALLVGYRRHPRLFAGVTVALIGVTLVLDLYLGLVRAVRYDAHEYFGTDTNALRTLLGSLRNVRR